MAGSEEQESWVLKAGKARISQKAQAIYAAFDAATDRLDLKDGEVLRLVLMETINQLQDGRGMIPAPLLRMVADRISEF